MAPEATQPATVTLPDSIITASDLAHVKLEIERLSDFLTQAKLRQPGTAVSVPRLSRRLQELSEKADLTLTQTADCDKLHAQVAAMQQSAPHMTISFAADPSDEFLTKLIHWFRTNIHPHVVLTIGLQPSIAAGFILRTGSHYYDCSMRKRLAESTEYLTDALYKAVPETSHE